MEKTSFTGLQAIGQFLLVVLQIALLIALAYSLASYNKRHQQTKHIYCQLYGPDESQKNPKGGMSYCSNKEAEGFSNATSDSVSVSATLGSKEVEIKLSKLNEDYWKHAVTYLVIANTLVFLSLSTLYKGGFGEVIVTGKHLASTLSLGAIGSPRRPRLEPDM